MPRTSARRRLSNCWSIPGSFRTRDRSGPGWYGWRKTAWFRHRAPLDEGLQLAAEEPEEGGLLELVQTLPDIYREVIFLRYYEGYEVREIAALLGRSPALVSTHLKRGKEKLKHLLGGTAYAGEF